MVHSIEHEKYEVAVQVSVLSYDLNISNETIPTMLSQHTLDELIEMRDHLLNTIDEQVALDGFYAVPAHINATWLATLMQTELGAYVDAETSPESDVTTIVRVEPGTV
ncbi:hypothetical protein SEA_DRYAD_99 [Streptomyces phage Dryad]|nr:hypothetical protein SEA_DRYAD_99 [Streptomyces phage Dryad]